MIVALVAVVVVVGTVILWTFFGDALSHRSHSAAARCVGGKESVAVVADPSIADPVQQLAESYNSTAGPVGDHCMVVSVKPAGSDAVLNGFAGKWPAELGGQPALWIPGSSISAARLAAAAGQKTITESHSLVTSPVMLAVRPELGQALANQNWAALPGLQTNPNALAGMNLPGWGSLRLALPMNGNGDASFLAGEAVAAASVPAGAPPTQGTGAVRTLLSAQPKLADNSLTEAMNTLLKPGDAATAPVHAVVTTEQQLFQRGQSLSDAKSTLGFLAAARAGAGRRLSHGAAQRLVADAGADLGGQRVRPLHAQARATRASWPRPASGSTGSHRRAARSPVSRRCRPRCRWATTRCAPRWPRPWPPRRAGWPRPSCSTSRCPAEEGGKTRLANVVAALQDKIKSLPPTAVVGLWTFDGHEGRSEVAGGPLGDPVNGQPRSAALTAALDKQYSSGGGAVSFTTLRMLYQEMQANYRAGQTNSILVITAGPHTDQTLDGPGLQDFIRKSADPAKPIAVNVIDFGGDPDRATWEAVAQLSGGGYQNLSHVGVPRPRHGPQHVFELKTAARTVASVTPRRKTRPIFAVAFPPQAGGAPSAVALGKV